MFKVFSRVFIFAIILSNFLQLDASHANSWRYPPPIVKAITQKNLLQLEILIGEGVDVNKLVPYAGGYLYPLSIALMNKNFNVIRILVESGARLDITWVFKSTPLIYPIVHNDIKLATYLIHEKANVNFANKKERSPFMYASQQGDVEMVKLLLKNGAHVHKKDRDGNTALAHTAMGGDHIEVVKLLIEAGADVSIENYYTSLNF